MMELKRWREELGLPFNLEPRFFPVDDIPAKRMVAAADLGGSAPEPLMTAFFKAVWEEERNIADPETMAGIATACGFDAEKLAAEAQRPEVTARMEADTAQAIEARVFGMPTWKIGEELFWGQDRLFFVEKRLQQG